MGLQVDVFLCFMASLVTTGLSQIETDDVKVVEVERFGGDLPPCAPRQVCADVFNFTRTNDDGSRRRESRLLINCRCGDEFPKCGRSTNQLLFRETRTQSMVTCENANIFQRCQSGDPAKEQHEGDLDYFWPNYVYHIINCVCPNNDHPRDFYRKMTSPMRRYDRYVRYYGCRDY